MLSAYPKTLSEEETLERAIAGRSIARVGEGEIKLALGRDCISQVADARLAEEMKAVLALTQQRNTHSALPCIARIWDEIPNGKFWLKFRVGPYLRLLQNVEYGSAFITRPDSAHNIDTPDYWDRLRMLWKNQDVVLVVGTTRSLLPSFLDDARSVRTVWGPRRDAYAEIDRIQEEIGKPSGPVILCLGATATVLAARLAKKNIWALDLGHVGMFIRHGGIYRLNTTDLISNEYLALQRKMHRGEYGISSKRYIQDVMGFAGQLGAEVVLDYGCGEGKLKLNGLTLYQYDPAIDGKDALPKPADLVVCTDVLEHIEPDKLGAVMAHIYALAKKGAYFVIALRPANLIMPDGRNAHLTVQDGPWWLKKLAESGWKKMRSDGKIGHALMVWAEK